MTWFPSFLSFALASTVGLVLTTDKSSPGGSDPISSRILETAVGERVLAQEIRIQAPVAEVWDCYVTEEGWTAWASPVAQVDLRCGGTIRTHYRADAEIGDPGTNVLHIVNYVPQKVLTLRAELQDNWPEVMKQDEGHLMNVIVFEPAGENTVLRSYGVGYRDGAAYQGLLGFFRSANEGLYRKLIAYAEDGVRDPHGEE